MPTYDYSCTQCAHSFEIVQAFSDDALTTCPECEGRLRKVFGNVGVVFKGSGFYRNDARDAAKKSSATAASAQSVKSDGGTAAPATSGTSETAASSSESSAKPASPAPSTPPPATGNGPAPASSGASRSGSAA
ncbi:MAG: FmdB family zinc ribbon protein [Angustibacter sp.]